jgi:hypothetical protein
MRYHVTMQTATSHHRASSGFTNPIDDQLYDLLQALVSKCEALEAYAKYEDDADDEARELFRRMGSEDARHAQELLDALRQRLNR